MIGLMVLAGGIVVLLVVTLMPSSEEPDSKDQTMSGMLSLGEPIENSFNDLKPRELDRFIRGLEQFPDFLSCLNQSEWPEGQDTPAILSFKKIRTFEEAEICFFWAAKYFLNPAAYQHWMEGNGFTVRVKNYDDPSHFRYGETVVVGTWPDTQTGTKSPFNLELSIYVQSFTARGGVTIFTTFDATNSPVSTNVSFPRGP